MWLEYKMDFFKKNVLFIGIGGITNALTPTGPTVLNTKEFSKKNSTLIVWNSEKKSRWTMK